MTTVTDRDTAIVRLDLPGAPAIDGLRFRRARRVEADYAAMAEVMGTANRHDDIPWSPSATNLRDEYEGQAGFDPTADCVIAEVDGLAVATASVDRVVRDDVFAYEIAGYVLPAWRRRGLGRALLHENLRRARERVVNDEGERPSEARAFVADTEAGQRALLEAEGFTAIRWFFEMRRPTLDDIPDAPLPDSLEIRPVTPDLHRVIWEADREAFLDHWGAREPVEEDFVSTFANSAIDTDLWVVAWDGDQVAGVVQPWIWRDENESLGVQRGWLEHISVRRPWRRMGLGRALTAEGLRRLRAAGMTDAMLGVDADNPLGALGLYESLGFEVFQRATAWGLPIAR